MTKGPWDSQDATWKSQVPHMTRGRQLPIEQSPLLYTLSRGTGILEAERTGVGPSYNPEGSTPSDVLPPARLHLLKVPLPSQASTAIWRPSIQARELMGNISQLNQVASCQVFCPSNGEATNTRLSLCLLWLELQLEISQGCWSTSHHEETLNQFLKAKRVFECLESNIRFAP